METKHHIIVTVIMIASILMLMILLNEFSEKRFLLVFWFGFGWSIYASVKLYRNAMFRKKKLTITGVVIVYLLTIYCGIYALFA